MAPSLPGFIYVLIYLPSMCMTCLREYLYFFIFVILCRSTMQHPIFLHVLSGPALAAAGMRPSAHTEFISALLPWARMNDVREHASSKKGHDRYLRSGREHLPCLADQHHQSRPRTMHPNRRPGFFRWARFWSMSIYIHRRVFPRSLFPSHIRT
jgi:hypothetical protein